MSKKIISSGNRFTEIVYWFQRTATLLMLALIFFPVFNPTYVCDKISSNLSLLTSAVSWDSLVQNVGAGFRRGQLDELSFQFLMIGAIVVLLGIAVATVGACMSFGNNAMKFRSGFFSIGGSIVSAAGLFLIYFMGYRGIVETATASGKLDSINPALPMGFWVFVGFSAVILIMSIINLIYISKQPKEEELFMPTPYKLFLIMLPFLLLCFAFSYLPLLGWRYAFFEYDGTGKLTADNFVGFKYFVSLVGDSATRKDVLYVLRNTMVMSGLGIITSWVPMAFAIFLNEIKTKWFKRIVQVFTTIPNFVSWVLVYALAIAIFSTDGFVNSLSGGSVQYLQAYPELTWLQMLGWGMWKSVGWSAIIYIAGISGIAPELYEAATVDGAGRGQKMWHITVPGLLPTYFVLLLMSIGNILSNGMEQYYVFENAKNTSYIQVLDLYVYKLGLGDAASIPLSTVVSMTKSIISIILLFSANAISKTIRGESIM